MPFQSFCGFFACLIICLWMFWILQSFITWAYFLSFTQPGILQVNKFMSNSLQWGDLGHNNNDSGDRSKHVRLEIFETLWKAISQNILWIFYHENIFGNVWKFSAHSTSVNLCTPNTHYMLYLTFSESDTSEGYRTRKTSEKMRKHEICCHMI